MSTNVSKIVVGRCCVISSVGQTRSISAARGPVGMITRSATSIAASIAAAVPGGVSTRTNSPGSLDNSRRLAAVAWVTSNGSGVPRCAARSAQDDADPCGSASTTRAGTPRRPAAAAKNIAVVVFATPPFVCTSDQITMQQHTSIHASICVYTPAYGSSLLAPLPEGRELSSTCARCAVKAYAATRSESRAWTAQHRTRTPPLSGGGAVWGRRAQLVTLYGAVDKVGSTCHTYVIQLAGG